MIYCRACPHLKPDDPGGLSLACKLSRQRCFVDDLPLTTMTGCPLKAPEGEESYEYEVKLNASAYD